MAHFLVTYDLNAQKDYQRLINELERLKGHRPALSAWFIDLNNTATEVRDHFSNFVDDDDFLIIVEFSKKPAFTKARAGTNAWISERF